MKSTIEENNPGDEVERVLLVFTGVVCIGTMINFTLAIPISTLYASALVDSAFLISIYAIGALISVAIFRGLYGTISTRSSYLVHCFTMLLGNGMLVMAAVVDKFSFALLARFVVGLEGGVMLLTNTVLVTNSSPRTRSKYLALYQVFVGIGLVSGPAIAAAGLFAGDFFGLIPAEAWASAFMCLWSLILIFMLLLFLSSEDKAAFPKEKQPLLGTANDTMEDRTIMLMGIGNFLRIAQRVSWEVGAILIAEIEFGWSVIAAALFISAYGFVQTASQFIYSHYFAGYYNDAAILRVLEVGEVTGIILIFGRLGGYLSMTSFIIGSILLYVCNCLTSAPYNNILLNNVSKKSEITLLVATQVGIFCAFGAGPLYMRIALNFFGIDQVVLAAVLLSSWAIQTCVNALVEREPPSILLHIALAFAVTGILIIAVLSPSLGGTGYSNLFSWHPILMSMGFFLFMTLGTLAYRDTNQSKPFRRRLHALTMILATLSSLAGYVCIFLAHNQSGESQIGINESSSRQAHVALGYIAFFWLLIQVFSGPIKAFILEAQGLRKVIWHGFSGRSCLLYGYLVAALGVWLHMNYSHRGWRLPLKFALTSLIFALLLFSGIPMLLLPATNANAQGGPTQIVDNTEFSEEKASSDKHLLLSDFEVDVSKSKQGGNIQEDTSSSSKKKSSGFLDFI